MKWIDIDEQLPAHQQRVLAFIPHNKVYLPGMQEFEVREVIVLKFLKDFYPDGSEKCKKHGAHFWQGEGNSNHFFSDITHWTPMIPGPSNLP